MIAPLTPFVLSLSKHFSPHQTLLAWRGPFDRLRANGFLLGIPC